MSNNISNNFLIEVAKFVENTFGLHFPEERFKDLKRALSNAAKEKCVTVEKYVNTLLLGQLYQEDIENLAVCLTIGETYFFRDRKLFETLREKILPTVISKKKYYNRTLKIWSAGCSSGEEAYTIAILLKELIPDYDTWDIHIIATDINNNFLSKAEKAVYSEWSFRGVDLSFKSKYFTIAEDKQYKLRDDIAKLVQFHNLNLASPVYVVDNQILNNFDIIFCRNVLIYFSKNQAQEIINRFYNTISDEGWLIVAPTEGLFLNDTSFIPVNINDMFLYNKDLKKDRLSRCFHRYNKINNLNIENEFTTGCFERNIIDSNKDLLAMKSLAEYEIAANYDNFQFHEENSSNNLLLQDGFKVNHIVQDAFKKKIDEDYYLNYKPISDFSSINLQISTEDKTEQNKDLQYTKLDNEQKVMEEDIMDVEKFEKLSRGLANEGKLAEALEFCIRAISINKINPIYYYLLASIQQEQGLVSEAIATLKKVIYLDTNFIMAYLDLGNLYIKQEKNKESLKSFKNAEELLNDLEDDDIVPHSEEITVGTFKQIIRNIVAS